MHLVTSDFILPFSFLSLVFLTENAGKCILDEMKHFQSYSQKSWHKIIWHAFLFFFTLTDISQNTMVDVNDYFDTKRQIIKNA